VTAATVAGERNDHGGASGEMRPQDIGQILVAKLVGRSRPENSTFDFKRSALAFDFGFACRGSIKSVL